MKNDIMFIAAEINHSGAIGYGIEVRLIGAFRSRGLAEEATKEAAKAATRQGINCTYKVLEVPVDQRMSLYLGSYWE